MIADAIITMMSDQSVALGWPAVAFVMNTMRRLSSGQYQILPAPVTSYCHCSSTLPLTVRAPRSLLNLCCLAGLVLSRGSCDKASHASRSENEQALAHAANLPAAFTAFAIKKGLLYIALKVINEAGRELHANDPQAAARYNLSILYHRLSSSNSTTTAPSTTTTTTTTPATPAATSSSK
jgi:hypothetical protein